MRLFFLFTCLFTSVATNPVAGFGVHSGTTKATPQTKTAFLESLESLEKLNVASKERTQLVRDLTQDNPTKQPGSTAGFRPFAPGLWVVVYAPHMSAMSQLVGGEGFTPVYYNLESDGTMVSHARFDIDLPPLPRASGWLSVSGTYGTQDDDTVCRVDFDKAWVKWNDQDACDDTPYDSLEEAPQSLEKSIVQTLGRWAFIGSFSVFPVSYLDKDLIVFDFELLGTRICARKRKKQ